MKKHYVLSLWIFALVSPAGSAVAHPGHSAFAATDPVHFAWHALPWVAAAITAVTLLLRRPASQVEPVQHD
jgi:hypothetical protein